MRLKNLKLHNIGPFVDAEIDFGIDSSTLEAPVTIITGENGTGKTIVLDAIRAIMLGHLETIERDIIRDQDNFEVSLNLTRLKKITKSEELLLHSDKSGGNKLFTNNRSFNELFALPYIPLLREIWVINYWTSKISNDSFSLNNLVPPQPENFRKDSLNGIQPNIEVTQLICFFDYLKSSDNPTEKEQGKYLFGLLKKIIKLSLLDGEFKYVERRTLTPIIHQSGSDISLDKLSSGNLYLIQRLVSLLGQMYSVHILEGTELKDLCNTPGVLLIDEAENHLHPKWQKTFLNSVLEIFPNLQLIVTTHSPFIVSSVKNANVYVCKSMGDHSIIEDQTAEYSNKPIEEILLSPVFETHSFNTEVTQLIYAHKQAVQDEDKQRAEEFKRKLLKVNPEYFSYLEVDDLLSKLVK